MMLRRWSVTGKLAVGFGLIIVLFTAAGYFACQNVAASLAALRNDTDKRLNKIQALYDIKQAHLEMEKYSFAMLNGFAASSQVDEYRKKYRETAKIAMRAWGVYDAMAKDAQETQIWVDYAAAWQVWLKEQAEFQKLQDQHLSGEIMREIAARAAHHETNTGLDIAKYLDELVKRNELAVASEQGKVAEAVSRLRLLLIGVTVMITLTAVLLTVYLAGPGASKEKRNSAATDN